MQTTSYKISEITQGLFDGPHATPKPSSKGAIFLGINNITADGKLDLTDIRYISEEEFPKWTKRVTPQYGDIVFTYEATLNRYAIIPKEFRGCLGRRLALIRVDPTIVNNRFLYYYFFTNDWRSEVDKHLINGSTVDRIPLSEFPNFFIKLPDKQLQDKIANVVCNYDSLIENNEKRIKILEEMAQRLYTEWFVKFKFPGYEKVKMVDSGTEFGLIPEGWEVGKIGDVAQERRNSTNPKNIDAETPYVGLEHLPRKSLVLSDWGKASEVDSTKLKFRKGNIIFGKIRPYFHKVVVAPLDGITSTDSIVIEPIDDKYFGLIIMYVFSENFIKFATTTSQGTKMPRAEWKTLTQYPVCIPDIETVEKFNLLIIDIINQANKLMMINRNLKSLRDLLIPQLVTGKRKLKNG